MIKKVVALIFTLLLFSKVFSQNSRLTIDLADAADFCSKIKSSVLVIPFINNSDKEIKAMKEAVRSYWKVSPYKFVSKLQFDKMREKDKKTANTIYLVKESNKRLKYTRKDWAYAKYYMAIEPIGVEVFDEPFIEFKLPVKSEGGEVKEVDYSFGYGLMIKQMNYDMELMCKQEEYPKIKRKSLIKARFDKSLSSYSSKELLVSRVELENFMMNLRDSRKKDYKESKFLKYISKKTKLNVNQIKLVSDEEVKNAVQTDNPNKLIYTGFTIYNASDGKMLRRIDPNRNKRKGKTLLTFAISSAILGIGGYFYLP